MYSSTTANLPDAFSTTSAVELRHPSGHKQPGLSIQPSTRTCQGASVQEPAAAGQPLLRPPHWAHAWMALEHVGAWGGGGGVGVGVHIHLRTQTHACAIWHSTAFGLESFAKSRVERTEHGQRCKS
jgi:hypothetical protein